MSVTLKVRNKDRLYRKLRRSVPGIEGELRTAIAKSADEMVALAMNYAPEKDGDLKRSIGWGWGSATAGILGRAASLRAIVFAGDDTAFYARWVEFGTKQGRRAQPFFFPAYRLLRKRIRSRLSRAMTKAIKAAGR